MVNILNIKQKGYAHNFVESSIIFNVPILKRHMYFLGMEFYPNMIVIRSNGNKIDISFLICKYLISSTNCGYQRIVQDLIQVIYSSDIYQFQHRVQ